MSIVAEILDRLTGIAIVRERLVETSKKADRLADAVLDHEKRLVRIETTVYPPAGAAPKRIPKK